MRRDLPYEGILRRLRVMALLALIVVVYGTVGYVAVQGWSVVDGLYMTLITLTTVGFTEVHPMDDAGRIFTMSLLVMGVGLIAVSLSLAAQLIQEGGSATVVGGDACPRGSRS